jgi:hypothetical protein
MPVPAMAKRNSRVLGRTVEDLVFSINMKAGFMVCDTVRAGGACRQEWPEPG